MKQRHRIKIGLFGGSFNPIHIGHLRAAEETREILNLEKIYFIPAALPPLKDLTNIAPPRDRLRMIKLAIKGNPFFKTSDIELKREGLSYTIDTIKFFCSKFSDYELYFIIGSELFPKIDTWKEYKSLFELSNFAVITRPGFSKDLLSTLPLALKDEFRYYQRENNLTILKHKYSKTLALVQIEGIQLSSTHLRNLINKKRSIKYLVTKEVEQYIKDTKLYLKETHR
ncbi:MAG TPA: nicotinate-nucleotide adenylyltransferase [Thermodesulfobacteriota bacterium]|jgi:nicotinate-nucleotide adenylyltransferase